MLAGLQGASYTALEFFLHPPKGDISMGQARNICLVGHSGCGKTTLAAALMTKAGIKDLTFDSSQEEKDRGYTIDMSVGTFKAKDFSITVLDTPGGDEFVEEMYKGVPVADLTLIMLNAEKGVEVTTERAWEITGGAQRPTAILINQMDRENAKFDAALSSVRDHFDGKFGVVAITAVNLDGLECSKLGGFGCHQFCHRCLPGEIPFLAFEPGCMVSHQAGGFDP